MEYPIVKGTDDRCRSESRGFTLKVNKPPKLIISSTSGENEGANMGVNFGLSMDTDAILVLSGLSTWALSSDKQKNRMSARRNFK